MPRAWRDRIGFADAAYLAALGATAPAWLLSRKWRGKIGEALSARRGDGPARDAGDRRPCVLVHAVSVGEVNAARGLVDQLRAARPDLLVVLTATTTTGLDRARALYANTGVAVERFPLDLTPWCARLLDRWRPDAVVLVELEVWPNFLRACAARGVPAVLANGRVTEPSFRKYRLLGPAGRAMFRSLRATLAQEESYADRFRELGARDVRVVGTMKFDTAQLDAPPDALADALALRSPTWVCGSTGPGEEAVVLDVYRALRERFADLTLALAPRKPERFDEVEATIRAAGFDVHRRTRGGAPAPGSVWLLDTLGELRALYASATVAFVGRSLVDLGPKQHGSDMIEPAALGVPVVVGRFTGNFAEPMRRFRAAGAVAEAGDAGALRARVDAWLADPDAARAVGAKARAVVVENRGATARHVAVILPLVPSPGTPGEG